MLRVSVRKGEPFRLELGPFRSWVAEKKRQQNRLKLRQIDRSDTEVWLAADVNPGHCQNLYILIDRGVRKWERLGLVLVNEDMNYGVDS